MNIKDEMLRQKGKWLITYGDNSKFLVDLDTMEFDSLGWYLNNGRLENNIYSIDEILINVRYVKKYYGK